MMWAMQKRCEVLYVQEPEGWGQSIPPRDESVAIPRLDRRSENLAVLRLPKLLASRSVSGAWNQTVSSFKARLIRRYAQKTHATATVAYVWQPELWHYVRALRPTVSVYHLFDLVDYYYQESYKNHPVRAAFEAACREADIVLAGTSAQASYIPRSDVEILPNAVPLDWYNDSAVEPPDLALIPRPRVGYVGSINRKLDLGWLEAISSRPKLHLVLVGPLGELSPEQMKRLGRIRDRPNVHYLGPKPAREVPLYTCHLDVGLLCYRRSTHMEFASPLKLYEYCAARIRIVAAPLTALLQEDQIKTFVTFAEEPESAAQAVEDLAMAGSNTHALEQRRFAEENSWDVRAEKLTQLIIKRLSTR
jgi:hypothetical protein